MCRTLQEEIGGNKEATSGSSTPSTPSLRRSFNKALASSTELSGRVALPMTHRAGIEEAPCSCSASTTAGGPLSSTSRMGMRKIQRHQRHPKTPYGVHTRGPKAGDRAPDASELKDIPSGSVSLFNDVFDFSRHMVLVFSAAVDPERYDALLVQLSYYRQGLVHCAAVVPAGVGTSGTDIARIGTGVMILGDTKGHAHAGYHSRFDGGCDIVVVRPDVIIGAVCSGSGGFGALFLPDIQRVILDHEDLPVRKPVLNIRCFEPWAY
ncbi:hypothetical protein B0H14DRAFT_2618624 [Mycena olivaceomarginata]|nr:hypothetical protein B0H14DRAFT_2618624 [Mycena olivaceomarginata]